MIQMQRTPSILPLNEINRALLENVHPPDWQNPEPAASYNLVVLGAGPAGLMTARQAAELGARVALVEGNLMGGDCLNLGCVPSKALIRCGRAARSVRNAELYGISAAPDQQPDFFRVMERMQTVRAGLSVQDSAYLFSQKLGIDLFFGYGHFSGPGTIEVDGRILRFKKAAICTGARASAPKIPGLDETGYLTSETVFSLPRLPERLAVIGAGAIGCEMAQVFTRLGSEVTLIESGSRLLPREDSDASRVVQRAFEAEGTRMVFHARLLRVFSKEEEKIIVYSTNGGETEMNVDAILVGVGRTPNVANLDLENAGVRYHPKSGIKVDDHLRTSNRRIFAAGDVCSAFKFSHTAEAQARILIVNALLGGRRRWSKLLVPWCTYTSPEVAHVGMYEQEARAKGLKVNTLTIPLGIVDRAQMDGETEGFARVHLKKGSDRILGATLVAHHAGEMINELTLAINEGLGLTAIARTMHPYPTQAEVIKKLAEAYTGSRIKPWQKKLLQVWLRWQNR
jgi:pyruvate/2-oxoglutarate dehydrogenase complex dihydrolipoamide dehydrogenase (E3) component